MPQEREGSRIEKAYVILGLVDGRDFDKYWVCHMYWGTGKAMLVGGLGHKAAQGG